MSTRERWTVYPLLFLALGAALRDKLTSSLDVRSISCEELLIASHEGKPGAGPELQLSPDRLVLYGADHKPVVAAGIERSAGKIATFSAEGEPQVVLQSTKRGGSVTAIDWRRRVFIVLGHEDDKFGIFMYDPPKRLTYAVPFVHTQTEPLSKPPGTSDGVRPDAEKGG